MDALSQEFADLAVRLHAEPDLEQTVDTALAFAMRAVACDHAGVMLVHSDGRVETIGVTDPVAEKADALQFDCQQGPCLAAIFDGNVFVIDDTLQDDRFPVWGPKVAEIGLRSVLSIRLRTVRETVGALNLYASEPGAFDHDDAAVAEVLARHTSIALSRLRQEFQMWEEIDARELVGQAQGILMERFKLSDEQAFAVLRRYSTEHGMKLREVAQLLIEIRHLP